MFEQTKKFCDSFLELGVPGFDLAVYQDGECILRYINGYSDLENKIKMNGHERYNVYSCSKIITCVAAMQLWEKGLFSLEDRLCDYMPEFGEMTVATDTGVKKAEKPILIKHLFEMTAGFSYKTESPELLRAREETNGRCPTRETMKYLAKEPLLFEPGTTWKYSLCHDVLGALVEVLSGQKFEDYVEQNIFAPLGMKESTFMLPEDEIDTIAAQYRFADGKPMNVGKQIQNNFKLGSEYASGGAGCISTVDDFIKFLEALRTHKLLKPETLALMTTNRLDEEQHKAFKWHDTHGYGLGVRCPIGIGANLDFGWGGAANAYFAIDPEHKITIYFGAHLLASPAAGLRTRLYRFVHAELYNRDELADIELELQDLYDYHLTY